MPPPRLRWPQRRPKTGSGQFMHSDQNNDDHDPGFTVSPRERSKTTPSAPNPPPPKNKRTSAVGGYFPNCKRSEKILDRTANTAVSEFFVFATLSYEISPAARFPSRARRRRRRREVSFPRYPSRQPPPPALGVAISRRVGPDPPRSEGEFGPPRPEVNGVDRFFNVRFIFLEDLLSLFLSLPLPIFLAARPTKIGHTARFKGQEDKQHTF